MSLTIRLSEELARLRGQVSSSPRTCRVSSSDGLELELDFTAVDSLSSSFRELRLRVPAQESESFEKLRAWSDELCRRVTYLLERLVPLESDPAEQTVLVRSSPPTREPDRTQFYEAILQSPGLLCVRRFRNVTGTGREQIDIQLTHEVLHKLATDIVPAVTVAPVA